MVAMDTLRSHKVRSALTILGIVIGVTSVISVASIIDGLNAYIQKKWSHSAPEPISCPVSRWARGSAACPRRSGRASTCQDTDAEFLRDGVSVSRIRDYVRHAGVFLRAEQRYPLRRETWSSESFFAARSLNTPMPFPFSRRAGPVYLAFR